MEGLLGEEGSGVRERPVDPGPFLHLLLNVYQSDVIFQKDNGVVANDKNHFALHLSTC